MHKSVSLCLVILIEVIWLLPEQIEDIDVVKVMLTLYATRFEGHGVMSAFCDFKECL